MTRNNLTFVKQNNVTELCKWPYCEKDVFFEDGFCATHHTHPYPQIYEEYIKQGNINDDSNNISKELLQKNQELSKKLLVKTISKTSVIPFLSPKLPDYSKYELTTVKNLEIVKAVGNLNNEITIKSDAYVEFYSLEQDSKAYFRFISKYGLFGVRNYYPKAYNVLLKHTALKVHFDPIFQIKLFHEQFKEIFDLVEKHLQGKEVDWQKCVQYFGDNFSKATRFFPVLPNNPSGLINTFAIYPTSLASTLIHQLFSHLRVGVHLKKCAFPECQKLTSNKYCSVKHENLFRQWKWRGKLKENKNGEVIVINKHKTKRKTKVGGKNGKHSKKTK